MKLHRMVSVGSFVPQGLCTSLKK